uniref:Tr-type G domain-containing protein n=1 Tax=Chromera velia CCMP2878 TaxID=1169474 RepID=A0A0G4HQX4_9ALVE|eukprot:Cvel_8007.t1-p1 / transcript=Cvel_8007.t1 / gene=Cvel_8007 / organism=Chromera_velia_CCMP2878 / gene_product=GTP-binding protein 2, putative / transcript_product=GTP-binding protein 2, putative / location=Cvel_scaffold431:75480-88252(+) / protein_length=2225 / sequence_SO=supercontig / SO=protein_coding / is_pseudo=false
MLSSDLAAVFGGSSSEEEGRRRRGSRSKSGPRGQQHGQGVSTPSGQQRPSGSSFSSTPGNAMAARKEQTSGARHQQRSSRSSNPRRPSAGGGDGGGLQDLFGSSGSEKGDLFGDEGRGEDEDGEEGEIEHMDQEEDEGNVEYKWKLCNVNDMRLDHLTTQMKYRLEEGGGVAHYKIGVEDSGVPRGLSEMELVETLSVIAHMCNSLHAQMRLNACNRGIEGKVADVTVTVSEEAPRLQCVDVRIAVLGDHDAGKSTLVGVLTSDLLDNGRGLARMRVLRHRHEVLNGKTSSVSRHFLGFDWTGKLVNCSSKLRSLSDDDIVQDSSKLLTLIDLAGHQKYLKTTMKGLLSQSPDYLLLVIPADRPAPHNESFIRMAVALRSPLLVVLSKTDRVGAAGREGRQKAFSAVSEMLERNGLRAFRIVSSQHIGEALKIFTSSSSASATSASSSAHARTTVAVAASRGEEGDARGGIAEPQAGGVEGEEGPPPASSSSSSATASSSTGHPSELPSVVGAGAGAVGGAAGIPLESPDEDVALRMNPQCIPVFEISCVTGQGVDLFRQFLKSVPPCVEWARRRRKQSQFLIDEVCANVKGVGMVVGGLMLAGAVEKGSRLFCGPFTAADCDALMFHAQPPPQAVAPGGALPLGGASGGSSEGLVAGLPPPNVSTPGHQGGGSNVHGGGGGPSPASNFSSFSSRWIEAGGGGGAFSQPQSPSPAAGMGASVQATHRRSWSRSRGDGSRRGSLSMPREGEKQKDSPARLQQQRKGGGGRRDSPMQQRRRHSSASPASSSAVCAPGASGASPSQPPPPDSSSAPRKSSHPEGEGDACGGGRKEQQKEREKQEGGSATPTLTPAPPGASTSLSSTPKAIRSLPFSTTPSALQAATPNASGWTPSPPSPLQRPPLHPSPRHAASRESLPHSNTSATPVAAAAVPVTVQSPTFPPGCGSSGGPREREREKEGRSASLDAGQQQPLFWLPVEVRSIHVNRVPVHECTAGQKCSFAISVFLSEKERNLPRLSITLPAASALIGTEQEESKASQQEERETGAKREEHMAQTAERPNGKCAMRESPVEPQSKASPSQADPASGSGTDPSSSSAAVQQDAGRGDSTSVPESQSFSLLDQMRGMQSVQPSTGEETGGKDKKKEEEKVPRGVTDPLPSFPLPAQASVPLVALRSLRGGRGGILAGGAGAGCVDPPGSQDSSPLPGPLPRKAYTPLLLSMPEPGSSPLGSLTPGGPISDEGVRGGEGGSGRKRGGDPSAPAGSQLAEFSLDGPGGIEGEEGQSDRGDDGGACEGVTVEGRSRPASAVSLSASVRPLSASSQRPHAPLPAVAEREDPQDAQPIAGREREAASISDPQRETSEVPSSSSCAPAFPSSSSASAAPAHDGGGNPIGGEEFCLPLPIASTSGGRGMIQSRMSTGGALGAQSLAGGGQGLGGGGGGGVALLDPTHRPEGRLAREASDGGPSLGVQYKLLWRDRRLTSLAIKVHAHLLKRLSPVGGKGSGKGGARGSGQHGGRSGGQQQEQKPNSSLGVSGSSSTFALDTSSSHCPSASPPAHANGHGGAADNKEGGSRRGTRQTTPEERQRLRHEKQRRRALARQDRERAAAAAPAGGPDSGLQNPTPSPVTPPSGAPESSEMRDRKQLGGRDNESEAEGECEKERGKEHSGWRERRKLRARERQQKAQTTAAAGVGEPSEAPPAAAPPSRRDRVRQQKGREGRAGVSSSNASTPSSSSSPFSDLSSSESSPDRCRQRGREEFPSGSDHGPADTQNASIGGEGRGTNSARRAKENGEFKRGGGGVGVPEGRNRRGRRGKGRRARRRRETQRALEGASPPPPGLPPGEGEGQEVNSVSLSSAQKATKAEEQRQSPNSNGLPAIQFSPPPPTLPSPDHTPAPTAAAAGGSKDLERRKEEETRPSAPGPSSLCGTPSRVGGSPEQTGNEMSQQLRYPEGPGPPTASVERSVGPEREKEKAVLTPSSVSPSLSLERTSSPAAGVPPLVGRGSGGAGGGRMRDGPGGGGGTAGRLFAHPEEGEGDEAEEDDDEGEAARKKGEADGGSAALQGGEGEGSPRPHRPCPVRPGMILVQLDPGQPPPRSVFSFEAAVTVLHHPTGLRPRSECVVHIHSIRQAALVTRVQLSSFNFPPPFRPPQQFAAAAAAATGESGQGGEAEGEVDAEGEGGETNRVRAGESGRVWFVFLCRPEFVCPGMPLMFSDGPKIKGVGQVLAIGE